jgi:glycosyltransferase involved in cell wall biosynthesis
MDRVVCVSEAQAEKVRRAGVRPQRVHVAHNAIDPDRFPDPDARYRTKLQRYFRQPRARIIGAAGRLSPEKGFDVLVAAAERVYRADRSVGFVLFGEGPCRPKLARQINSLGLAGTFILSGFRGDLDRFMPFFDLLVLPSYSEGLPNVVLEAFAAGVPVVATRAGGTPEIVEEGVSGHLVRPGDAAGLADRILTAMASEDRLRDMGLMGRQRILEGFTFRTQAARYVQMLSELVPAPTDRVSIGSAGVLANAVPAAASEPELPENKDLVPTVPACEP